MCEAARAKPPVCDWAALHRLSWDICEPLSYFVGTGLTTIGFFWWLMTRSEFEYTNMAALVQARRAKVSAAATGLSPAELHQYAASLSRAKSRLLQDSELLALSQYSPDLLSALAARGSADSTVSSIAKQVAAATHDTDDDVEAAAAVLLSKVRQDTMA